MRVVVSNFFSQPASFSPRRNVWKRIPRSHRGRDLAGVFIRVRVVLSAFGAPTPCRWAIFWASRFHVYHSFSYRILRGPPWAGGGPLRELLLVAGFLICVSCVVLPHGSLASSPTTSCFTRLSFNVAQHMAWLCFCIALLLSTGLAQAAISSLSASYLLLLSLVLPPSLCSCVRCPHLDSCFCCFFWASCLARVASSCIVHVWRGLCQLAPAR